MHAYPATGGLQRARDIWRNHLTIPKQKGKIEAPGQEVAVQADPSSEGEDSRGNVVINTGSTRRREKGMQKAKEDGTLKGQLD